MTTLWDVLDVAGMLSAHGSLALTQVMLSELVMIVVGIFRLPSASSLTKSGHCKLLTLKIKWITRLVNSKISKAFSHLFFTLAPLTPTLTNY